MKLLAIGKQTEAGIEVRVHPTFVRQGHPLAAVNDSFNAVYLTGDSVGDVMLYGRGAERFDGQCDRLRHYLRGDAQ